MKKVLFTLGLVALAGVMVACGGTSSSVTPSTSSGEPSVSSPSAPSTPSTSVTPSTPSTTTPTVSGPKTVAEALAAEDGTAISGLKMVVVAKHKNGFIGQDSTGLIYVYGFDLTANVGDYVSVTGSASDYYEVNELDVTKGSVTVLEETAPTLTAPTKETWDAAKISEHYANPEGVHYISVADATVKIDGKYTNIVLDGLTGDAKGLSVSFPDDSFKFSELNGATVTLEGYTFGVNTAGWVNLLVTSVEATETPSTELPTTITDKTIAEVAASDSAMKDVFYRVKGIATDITNTTYGNMTLVDPTTGDTLTIYGVSSKDSKDTAFTFDGAALDYSNPKDFSTLDIKEGNYVELVGILDEQYPSGPLSFMGYAETINDGSAYTYKASVTVSDSEFGSATLSKTEGIAFGEKVTINITPNSGYRVSSVVVDHGASNETVVEEDGVYAFTASVVNKVTVTFVDASILSTSMTITSSTFDGMSAYGDYTGSVNVNGTAVNVTANQVADYGDGLQFRFKNDLTSLIYSTSAIPGDITSIVVKFTDGKNLPKDTLFGISVGSAETTTVSGISIKDYTYTYTADGENDTFFALGHTGTGSGSFYIESITINFTPAE